MMVSQRVISSISIVPAHKVIQGGKRIRAKKGSRRKSKISNHQWQVSQTKMADVPDVAAHPTIVLVDNDGDESQGFIN